jgi:flagellar basal-body rod protein FlgG
MSDAITMIEAAMRADAEALRVIGQNIANADVPAYRRQIAIGAVGFDALVARTGLEAKADNVDDVRAGPMLDARPGTLRSTGEAMHVALEGSGFLVLQSNGGVLLTRRGDLGVSAEGYLSAASGEPVLGTAGLIHVGAAVPTIDTAGNVRVGADIVDQLRVVQVEEDAQLQYVGNGMYLSPTGSALENDGRALVRQGFLETSNVTPVGEMVQMMETLRHYEAAQRFVRGYDELLEKAISELGKVG